MIYYLSSIAIITFEVICCTIFYESFCKKIREQKKYRKLSLIISMVAAFFVCALFLSQWLIVKQLAVILITVVFMKLYYRISIKKSVVFALLYHGLLLLVDYIAYAVNSTIFSDGVTGAESTLEGNMVIVLSKIIVFLCVLIIKNGFGNKSTELLIDTEWIRFLFFPTFTIIIIVAITMAFKYVENYTQALVLYVMAFGMVGMNIFVYYLINSIIEREAELHKKKSFEMQVKNQVEMYHSISESFEKQKRKTHEFKNHILCIEGLLKNGKYDELEKYVSDISLNLINEKNAINANNAIINAILNTKYQEAVSKKIVFVCKVNDLAKIEFSDEDIVILLANLLNNAIEACEVCTGKRILKLKFIKEDKNIILSVKNTYAGPVVYKNNEIVTTKTVEADDHGVGIKNIIRIVEKYKGSYVIQNYEGEFYFSILFPV